MSKKKTRFEILNQTLLLCVPSSCFCHFLWISFILVNINTHHWRNIKIGIGKHPDFLFHILPFYNQEKFIRLITNSLREFEMEKYEIFNRFWCSWTSCSTSLVRYLYVLYSSNPIYLFFKAVSFKTDAILNKATFIT